MRLFNIKYNIIHTKKFFGEILNIFKLSDKKYINYL